MTDSQRLLVESTLFTAINAFHDIDDKAQREQYVREYFFEFCSKNNIDPEEAYQLMEKFLEHRRNHTIFKYEHYKNLKGILFGKKASKKVPKGTPLTKPKQDKDDRDDR